MTSLIVLIICTSQTILNQKLGIVWIVEDIGKVIFSANLTICMARTHNILKAHAMHIIISNRVSISWGWFKSDLSRNGRQLNVQTRPMPRYRQLVRKFRVFKIMWVLLIILYKVLFLTLPLRIHSWNGKEKFTVLQFVRQIYYLTNGCTGLIYFRLYSFAFVLCSA